MTTVAAIGQYILDINNYNTPTVAITEKLIDDAIDEINAECGTSIADLGGSEGSKTLTGTEDEIAAVKLLSSLKLRSRNARGPALSISGLSKGTSPSTALEEKRLERMLGNLKALPIVIKNDPLPNE
jgi:hypothetical protein